MTKRAVIYARVSGDDRGKDGRNLAGQIAMGREYAAKHGYSIIAELPEDDRGASGAEIDLPKLNEIREMAARRQIDVLIVREIDRLSRNLAKQLIVEEELRRRGVSIEYVLGEYPNTPEGDLMKHIRASISEYERYKITERQTRGRQLSLRRGNIIVYSHIPYGYLLKKEGSTSRLEIYEPEARIIRLIYNHYLGISEEKMSLQKIAKHLNALGVERPIVSQKRKLEAKTGRPAQFAEHTNGWTMSSVQRVLRTETYAGVWRYGKYRYSKSQHKVIKNPQENLITVEVPAIISRETWEAAQAQTEENRKKLRRNPRYPYLLLGHVVCLHCESPMTGRIGGNSKKPHPYYRCGVRWLKKAPRGAMRDCDGYKEFRADCVDWVVWEWIRSFLLDPENLRREIDRACAERDKHILPLKERLAIVDDLIRANQVQVERLLDLYQHDQAQAMVKDALLERLSRLKETTANLENERAKLMIQIDAQNVSNEQLKEVETIAAKMREAIEMAAEDIGTQRYVVDKLEIEVKLGMENGERVAYAQCVFGKKVMALSSNNGVGRYQPYESPGSQNSGVRSQKSE